MDSSYSVLVNTCDKFEDCWDPFFKLLSLYWRDFKGTIYLNTEYKDFSYEGLNIVALKVCERNNFPKEKRASWSQCLQWALMAIDDDVVLYLQEDYFFKDYVKNNWIEKYLNLMVVNEHIMCIHLTDQAVKSIEDTRYESLKYVIFEHHNRISCQAALWRKSELIHVLREYESGWEFEEFGSRRSGVIGSDYYVVDPKIVRLNQFEIIPYIFTGVVQGRWKEEVVPLFQKHKINIDFGKRGFLKDATPYSFVERVINKIKRIPKVYRHKREMILLKKQLKNG